MELTRRVFLQVLAVLGFGSRVVAASPTGIQCPRCGTPQAFVCSNPDCACQRVKPGISKLGMTSLEDDWLFCLVCGFTAHIDFWAEQELQHALKADPSSPGA